MRGLNEDLRLAWRGLRRSPGFAAAALATLALGIGVTTAVFSLVDAVLLRPLPLPQPERLVRLLERHPGPDGENLLLTYATFLDLRQAAPGLDAVAGWRPYPFNLGGDAPERVGGALVSAGWFELLGVSPALGRGFAADEHASGRDAVVVLSHGVWSRRFGSDPSVLGRALPSSDGPLTVVGVMPAGFDFPDGAQLWSPLVTDGPLGSNRRSHLIAGLGRLPHADGLATAQAGLQRLAEQLDAAHPAEDSALGLDAVPLHDHLTGPWRRALLLLLLLAVGLLLLIACADVGGLLLVRGAGRERELAVRASLGATSGRLARLLLAESLLLGVLGGLGGLAAAALFVDGLVALAPVAVPRLADAALDLRAAAFAFACALLTGLVFGMVPIACLRTPQLAPLLAAGGRGSTAGREGRLGGAVIVGQVALTLTLLAGGALLARSLERLASVEVGYRSQGIVSLPLFLSDFRDGERRAALFEPLLEQVRALPGVEDAALANVAPMNGGPMTPWEPAEAPRSVGEPETLAAIRVVDAAYFRTLEIPLLRGRLFRASDRPGAPQALLVSRSLAEREWPGQDPVGRRVTMKDWGPPLTGEIVGVVGDVRLDGPDRAAPPTLYWPYAQFPTPFVEVLVRSSRPRGELAPLVAARLQALQPGQPLGAAVSLEEIAEAQLAQRRFAARLLQAFGLAALALSGLGLYGLAAWSVSRRTRELGLRMALGAERRDLVRLVLSSGLRLAAWGVLLGIPGASLLGRGLSHLLYGVGAADPVSFAAAGLLLLAATLLAAARPAWRAGRLDPVTALRAD